jgi:adenosine deaminase
MNDLRPQIHKLSKGDMHNHLHLSAGITLLKEKHPKLKFKTPANYKGFAGMMQFIEQNINAFMTSSENVIDLMDLGIRSSIADNVTFLEASVDINLYKFFNHSVEKFIQAVSNLKEKHQDQIDFKPEIGINKDSSQETINEIGMQCVDSGVFNSLDIYGDEYNQNLTGFQNIYKYAKTKNLKTKAHIGEFSDHKTIENAIELLEPDEIQHGIRAVDSNATLQMILERGIRLNLCPQSNIALGAAADYPSHPIRKLYDSGIKLTVNTDDLLLFNASLTDQYIDLIEQGVFSFEEMNEIRLNAFS